MTNQKLKAFKEELKQLLYKHDASITFICDDTQGIQGESIGVMFHQHEKEEYPLVGGYSVDAYDLKINY